LIHNSVGRATSPRPVPLESFFYWRGIWASSYGFRLALPALAWGGLCALLAWRRGPWLLLSWLAGSFALALSCAREQHFHYIYAVFPALSVMVAAMLVDGIKPAAISEAWQRRLHVTSVAAGMVCLALVWPHDLARVHAGLTRPMWEYPPLAAQARLEAAGLLGEVSLVLYDYPSGDHAELRRELGWFPFDRHYARRLPLAVHVHSLSDLNTVVEAGRPALVFLPPLLKPEDLLAHGLAITPDRHSALRSERGTYPLLVFNGALQHPPLEDFVRRYEVSAPRLERAEMP
jgi:hypothetical protein